MHSERKAEIVEILVSGTLLFISLGFTALTALLIVVIWHSDENLFQSFFYKFRA